MPREMKALTFMHVQDHLSTEGVFLMGDAQVAGFPIRYASLGFEELFGYHAADIIGKKCGDLIGGPLILASQERLAGAATDAGCSLEDTRAKIHFLTSKAGEACRLMMENPGARVGVAVLLNSKKSGTLFVCEVILLCLKHPHGFSYCVGFQRDISKDVPLRALFAAAASDDHYAGLLKHRSAALESRREVLLGVGKENVVRYLHEKASDVFAPMSTASFMHVQDFKCGGKGHLSTEGVFLMGDARAAGFPIRYASLGFEELFGYRSADVVGRKCGDLIGGPSILASTERLAAAAAAAGCSLEAAAARLQLLTRKAGEACRVMMANPGTRVGVALLVNAKKSGVLFVCEVMVICLQQPAHGWSYCVGFQRDISGEVPLRTLLAAAGSEAEYAQLLEGRGASLERRRAALLGVGGEGVVRYLHEKASDVFSQLHSPTFRHVQEHLSTEGVFLMGDAQVAGFPIRYASPGFEQLYGYNASDIVGKKCGDLIGGPCIVADTESLATLASAAGCSVQEARARVQLLTSKAGEACRVMLAGPGRRVGVALLANRRKGGELFVCECIVLCLEHPTMDWRYCVGFQRDISKDVPLSVLLLAAASEENYAALLKSRSAALESRRAVLLGVGSDNVIRYLHEKALDVFSMDLWRTLRAQLLTTSEATALGGKGKHASPSDASTAAPCTSSASHCGSDAGSVHVPAGLVLLPQAPAGPAGPRPQLALPAPYPALATSHPPLHQLGGPGCVGPMALVPPAAPAPGTPAVMGYPSPPAQASTPAGPSVLACAPHMGVPGTVSAVCPPMATTAPPPHCQYVAPSGHPGYSYAQVMESNPVVQFLQHAQLNTYAAPLLANGFDDLQTLLEIEDEDMKNAGIPRGHQLKLKRSLQDLKCIQMCALRNGLPPEHSPTLLQNMYCGRQ